MIILLYPFSKPLWCLLIVILSVQVIFGDDCQIDEETCANTSETEEDYSEIVNLLDDEECLAKANDGMCNKDTEKMLHNCLRSCLGSENLLEIGYFKNRDGVIENDENCHEDKPLNEEYDEYELLGVEEFDKNSCLDRRDRGDCIHSPDFMEANCPHACMFCRDPTEDYFFMGVAQSVWNMELLEETLQVMVDSMKYMVEEVMEKDEYKTVRHACKNEKELCSQWAAEGLCEEDIEVSTLCGPACQTCEHQNVNIRCSEHNFDPIIQPGDLNKIFDRITTEYYPDQTTIHSQPPGPWIITIDDFLTKEECEHLISLGPKLGFKRSLTSNEDDDNDDDHDNDDDDDNDDDNDDDDDDDDHNVEEDVTKNTMVETQKVEMRKSSTAWCNTSCYDDPITNGVIHKIEQLTGLPRENAEFLQFLHYVEGQYYVEHHDSRSSEMYSATGPRILTVFLYLNAVEKGGETKFNNIDNQGTSLVVEPKPGMALIWPSVRNDEPAQVDYRTYHEAMKVNKGVKYGTNAWIRLRKFHENNDCDAIW